MDKYLKQAEMTGLLDVIKEWMKTEKYISASSIQRNFSVGFKASIAIFDYLIKEKLIENKPTYDKGHKVIGYNPLFPMKVYLLDINPKMTKELKREFDSFNNVKVINDNFIHFMETHKDVECVVSPGNAFGYMDGGYDKAIIDYFGGELEQAVQRYIDKHLFGEQPVGTSFMVDIPKSDKKLIHTPSMRLPSPIKDKAIIYQCMRSTLMCAIEGKIHSIVIPSFGGLTGKVEPKVIARYMRLGYEQILDYMKDRTDLKN